MAILLLISIFAKVASIWLSIGTWWVHCDHSCVAIDPLQEPEWGLFEAGARVAREHGWELLLVGSRGTAALMDAQASDDMVEWNSDWDLVLLGTTTFREHALGELLVFQVRYQWYAVACG